VSRLSRTFGGDPTRLFLSVRGISSAIALVLALSYTKILGIEKRSLLTFIMVSALILTIILTSGFSLALRNKPKSEIKDEEFFGYFLLVIISSLVAGSINCLLLLAYSYSNTIGEIPAQIYIVCFVYSALACMNLGVQDALLAAGSLKIATVFDLTTILIQVTTLIFFVSINQTSLLISVFIAFIFSYSLVTFGTLAIFLNSLTVNAYLLASGMKSIIAQSKKQHILGIASGLVDRVDRFLIGLILPVAFLAKYALLSSITSFARFLPDSAAKLQLLRHHQEETEQSSKYTVRAVAFICLSGLLFVATSQTFIYIVFGIKWLLPISVAFLLVCQEILRGNYQIKAMKLVALGGLPAMSRISGKLIFLSVSLISVCAYFFGIWGTPLAMIVVYFLLTRLIENELKMVLNAS
jgi:hypothetical protein